MSTTATKGNLPPPPSEWTRPVFVAAGAGTIAKGHNDKTKSLPIGVPFDFETDLVRGRMLLRFRSLDSDDQESHEAYFNDRKRVMQTVVQCRFKTAIGMDKVYVGSHLRQAMKHAPPTFFLNLMDMLFQRVAPGTILDLGSDNPKVTSLYTGAAQTISVDLPGSEPDMTAVDLPEETSRGFGEKVFRNRAHRKRSLSAPTKAARYIYDTEHVYTFHTYDDNMDYGNYTIKLPMMSPFKIAKALGEQPMTLTASMPTGQILYHFDVWHEDVYPTVDGKEEDSSTIAKGYASTRISC